MATTVKKLVKALSYFNDDCLVNAKAVNSNGNCVIITEDGCGHEMTHVKPLAQYLDEYIEHELADSTDDSWREFFERALTAYEETEQVKIRIEQEWFDNGSTNF